MRSHKFKIHRDRYYYLRKEGGKCPFQIVRARVHVCVCRDVDQIYIFKGVPTRLPAAVKDG